MGAHAPGADSLKPRIDFDQPVADPVELSLRAAQVFDARQETSFEPLSADPEAEEALPENWMEAALKPKRSIWRRMVMAGIGLFVLSGLAQMGSWFERAWQQQDWFALGTLGAGTLVLLAGAGSLAAEWRQLYRLRQRAEQRDLAGELLRSHAIGQGREFCLRLAGRAGIEQGHPALRQWLAALQDTHSDREVVGLYARMVQPVIDRRARREISRSAAESALMIAVSPLAVVDMGFIAWRNLRLINRIAAIYGIEVGYYSRLRLFRLVLLNIAFAGVSEWVREVGMDWMSQDLAARLSARAAQGMGAGLLTARLGIKAMELCRPLPWIDGDKPRLGDYRRELIGQLKSLLERKSPS
ncbi:TIGR01620 family protein [Sodalis sp. dw_96]|uniref:TIGR01620 family protein n=1 Tax=Sodalis sp. dw_96 TaxID=2719794 RepID=UPI001BD3F80B|nr:TIGR01620 family protein [Sodalis sp. dw_96]